ncbi:MAG: NTP transferase domain-containing protein [Gemmatimonadales bacterium]
MLFPILLAAGQNRRFGASKLLAPLGGRPLIAHVLAAIEASREGGLLGPGAAVLAETDPELHRLVTGAGLVPVINPDPSAGLASSLRLGIAWVASRAGITREDAALVILADQPGLRTETVQALAREYGESRAPIVRPRYRRTPQVPGHPVLLAHEAWPLVEELQGDRGLGQVLEARPALVRTVDVEGENPDVDRPEDLARLSRMMEREDRP